MVDCDALLVLAPRHLGVAVVSLAEETGSREPGHGSHDAELEQFRERDNPLFNEGAVPGLLPIRK
jgi:hypothetical protein